MESALKFQRAGGRFGFQDSSQSVFGKPEMCMLCNSSEVRVWRYGRALVGSKGDACKRFVPKKGVRFENLSSNNHVSAAGQVAAETLMLISERAILFQWDLKKTNKTKINMT